MFEIRLVGGHVCDSLLELYPAEDIHAVPDLIETLEVGRASRSHF